MARKIPASEQWRRIQRSRPDECWPYIGPYNPDGYGLIWKDRKATLAHRWVWAQMYGPIRNGLWVLHSCDNPPCCNPHHLRLGTALDNNRDREKRQRRNVRGSRNPFAKLTEDQVREIRARYAAGGISQERLGDEYGVTQVTVGQIVSRRWWQHI